MKVKGFSSVPGVSRGQQRGTGHMDPLGEVEYQPATSRYRLASVPMLRNGHLM